MQASLTSALWLSSNSGDLSLKAHTCLVKNSSNSTSGFLRLVKAKKCTQKKDNQAGKNSVPIFWKQIPSNISMNSTFFVLFFSTQQRKLK